MFILKGIRFRFKPLVGIDLLSSAWVQGLNTNSAHITQKLQAKPVLRFGPLFKSQLSKKAKRPKKGMPLRQNREEKNDMYIYCIK